MVFFYSNGRVTKTLENMDVHFLKTYQDLLKDILTEIVTEGSRERRRE